MSAYQIDFSDPLKAGFQIAPGGFNGPGGSSAATTMRLYGRGALEWGEAVDEDLVRLTENFASASPPSSPISGQLWVERSLYYRNDSVGNVAQGWYYYDMNETAANKWKLLNGTGVVATSAPVTPVEGQYWFDTSTNPDTLYGYYSLGKYEPLSFVKRSWFSGTGAPTSSTLPRQYLRIFDNAASSGAGAWVAPQVSIVSTTTPVAPQIGMFWYNTSTGNLLVYTGSAWQEILGPGTGAGNTAANDNVNMQNTYKIINLVNPTNAQDAATKSYVDSLVGGVAGFLPITGGTLTVTTNPGLTINRTNSSTNSVIAFQTTGGTIYAGQGATGLFAVDDDATLSSGPWLTASATAFTVPGSFSAGTTGSFGGNLSVTGSGSFTTSVSTGTTLTVGTNLTVNGTTTMNGLVTLSNDRITGVATPSLSSDAATKGYVDSAVAGAGGLDPADVALVGPTVPKDGDIRVVGSTIDIYASGAWRRVWPAQWSA